MACFFLCNELFYCYLHRAARLQQRDNEPRYSIRHTEVAIKKGRSEVAVLDVSRIRVHLSDILLQPRLDVCK